MVTAGTYRKEKFFDTPDHLQMLHDLLFKAAQEFDWRLQAWAVLANHYHLIATSQRHPTSLKAFLSKLHAVSARAVNKLDAARGRKVWFQYWDTQITFERSYLVRLNYVHNNPVHHGLVENAAEYPYCSAAWFARTADASFRETVSRFKTDRISVRDDF